ncbi:hypothetical protein [Streptomyces sp. NPDC093097]|uniref:hypothetical protein n=1 Tax=Streptomyces sp. NPDC093097 TaxID=3366027 RepID=UPI0037F84DE0
MSVVFRATKNVARKTTSTQRSAEETNRYYAWQHLLTPQAPIEDEWVGELATAINRLDPSGSLGEVAAKYDRLIQLVELDATDDIDETDLLAGLLVIRTLRDKLHLDEGRLLGAARRKKITWTRLADALEMRNRQSAERRYLQLRTDMDEARGVPMVQSERVEFIRAQRDRRVERRWASEHHRDIAALARRLAAVPDLQHRADRARRATERVDGAAKEARKTDKSTPPPGPMPWPKLLQDNLALHDKARETDLTAVQHTDVIHTLFGLIGYACRPDYISLPDHEDLVHDIRQLYCAAGDAAPRAPYEYLPTPSRPTQDAGREADTRDTGTTRLRG